MASFGLSQPGQALSSLKNTPVNCRFPTKKWSFECLLLFGLVFQHSANLSASGGGGQVH